MRWLVPTMLVASTAFSGCYLSHGRGDRVDAGRFGVFTFASCTGSGVFHLIAICPDGSALLRGGSLGMDGAVRAGGWSALDAEDDRIEVLGVRGGIWVLRWDGEERTWRCEDPIDGCAERGLRPGEAPEALRPLAADMTCR